MSPTPIYSTKMSTSSTDAREEPLVDINQSVEAPKWASEKTPLLGSARQFAAPVYSTNMPTSSTAAREEPLVDTNQTLVPEWASEKTPQLGFARQFVADNTGFLLAVLSQAFFSLMNAAIKQLSTLDPPVSALQIILVRMIITYTCSVAYMTAAGIEDPILGPKGVRMILVFRGLTGFISLFGSYFSLQYLTLSDATVLSFLSPLCTAIAGALFLKETFRLSQAFAGVVSLIGVILIAKPPFLFGGNWIVLAELPILPYPDSIQFLSIGESAGMRMVAVGVALLGVLGMTGSYVSVRAIGKQAHSLHIMNAFASQCIIATVIGMVVTKTPFIVPRRLEWFSLLLMVGIFGFLAQILLTMGLQREAAGRASIAIYTQIVFALVLQVTVFHTFPTSLSTLGTVLILSSAIYVAMNKEKTSTAKGKIDDVEAALHGSQKKAGKSPTN